MLDINPGLILWTILTFIILLFILSKVGWKPLVNALQAREQSIRDALQKAEEAKRESERLLAENTAAMARANEETSRILKEGRELAEQMKSEIVAKAREGAKALMEQAKEDIQRVYAPIGLPIEAETPEEIGVSITAELIKVRAQKAR